MEKQDEPLEESFPLRLTLEVLQAYNDLKAEYKEIFRDIRKRHRGIARDHLIQANEGELQKKVRELFGGLGDSPS